MVKLKNLIFLCFFLISFGMQHPLRGATDSFTKSLTLCQKSTSGKLPQLENIHFSKFENSKTYLKAEFTISENLELLKGHFPDFKVFPGASFARMATLLLGSYYSSLGIKAYNFEIPEFQFEHPGLPGDRVFLHLILEHKGSGQDHWLVKVNKNSDYYAKDSFAKGKLNMSLSERNTIPPDAYSEKKENRLLFTEEMNFDFIEHGIEVAFPIQTKSIHINSPISYTSKIPKLEELNLAGNKLVGFVKLPADHLLMHNMSETISILPASHMGELGAQAAVLSLAKTYPSPFPLKVRLRSMKNLFIQQNLVSGVNYKLVVEITKSKYIRRGKMLMVDFKVSFYANRNNLVGGLDLSGLLLYPETAKN